jgi:hypothetical protein
VANLFLRVLSVFDPKCPKLILACAVAQISTLLVDGKIANADLPALHSVRQATSLRHQHVGPDGGSDLPYVPV